jgi:hypothetical protein
MQIPLCVPTSQKETIYALYADYYPLTIYSAYELYADPTSDVPPEIEARSDDDGLSMADRFKSVFSHPDVKVHFVGAWYVLAVLPFWTASC